MFTRVRGFPGHAFVEEQQVSDQLTCQVADGQMQLTLVTAEKYIQESNINLSNFPMPGNTLDAEIL